MTETLLMPRASGWAIPDDALDLLAGLVREHRPGLVLEAGSGRSTIVLAHALRDVNRGRLLALEHDPDFAHENYCYLRVNNLAAGADVLYAPLGENGWYAEAAWRDLEGIDLLLVDGPPGHVAPLARYPALPNLRDRLTPGALVILDDTNRPDEQETLRRWQEIGLGELTIVPHSTGELAYGYFRP